MPGRDGPAGEGHSEGATLGGWDAFEGPASVVGVASSLWSFRL